MNKLRYIFLSILTCASSIDAKLDNPQRPISANLYKTLTPINLVHGQKITKPGAYLLSSSTTIPDTIYSSQNTTTIGGDATSYNTGVISIETNNVTLDLNGLSLKTNKNSLVAIQIADGVSNIVIENGTIAPGTETWSNAILIGYDTKNITLKNLTFIGCSNSNGSVHIFGDATHFVDNVLLENIQVLNQTGLLTLQIKRRTPILNYQKIRRLI